MPPPKRVFDYAFTISDQHMNVRDRDTSYVPFFALPQQPALPPSPPSPFVPGQWPRDNAFTAGANETTLDDAPPAPRSFAYTMGMWALTKAIPNILALPYRITQRLLRPQQVFVVNIDREDGARKKRIVDAGAADVPRTPKEKAAARALQLPDSEGFYPYPPPRSLAERMRRDERQPYEPPIFEDPPSDDDSMSVDGDHLDAADDSMNVDGDHLDAADDGIDLDDAAQNLEFSFDSSIDQSFLDNIITETPPRPPTETTSHESPARPDAGLDISPNTHRRVLAGALVSPMRRAVIKTNLGIGSPDPLVALHTKPVFADRPGNLENAPVSPMQQKVFSNVLGIHSTASPVANHTVSIPPSFHRPGHGLFTSSVHRPSQGLFSPTVVPTHADAKPIQRPDYPRNLESQFKLRRDPVRTAAASGRAPIVVDGWLNISPKSRSLAGMSSHYFQKGRQTGRSEWPQSTKPQPYRTPGRPAPIAKLPPKRHLLASDFTDPDSMGPLHPDYQKRPLLTASIHDPDQYGLEFLHSDNIGPLHPDFQKLTASIHDPDQYGLGFLHPDFQSRLQGRHPLASDITGTYNMGPLRPDSKPLFQARCAPQADSDREPTLPPKRHLLANDITAAYAGLLKPLKPDLLPRLQARCAAQPDLDREREARQNGISEAPTADLSHLPYLVPTMDKDLSTLEDAPNVVMDAGLPMVPDIQRAVHFREHAEVRPFFSDEKTANVVYQRYLTRTAAAGPGTPVKAGEPASTSDVGAASAAGISYASASTSANASPNTGGHSNVPATSNADADADAEGETDPDCQEADLSLDSFEELVAAFDAGGLYEKSPPSKQPLPLPSPPPAKVPVKALVVPLSAKEQNTLNAVAATAGHGKDPKVIVGDSDLEAGDFGTLLPYTFNGDKSAWLNDIIVNDYLKILTHAVQDKDGFNRSQAAGGPAPRVHAFSSYWYTSSTYSRWGKKAHLQGTNFLQAELLLYPVCDRSHWRLIAVKPKERKIEYLDSLYAPSSAGSAYIKKLKFLIKKDLGDDWNEREWTVETTQRSQRQLNTSDCGVFTCMNALALLRGIELDKVLACDGMDDARKRMAITLLAGKATTEF